MKKLACAILLIGLTQQAAGQSVLSHLYGTVLGSEDVKQEYKTIVHNALRAYGVKDPESVAVKKMNHIGSFIAQAPISSFTACGIWLDEEYLDTRSEQEQTFQLYHEAAHYARYHHLKIVSIGAWLSCAAALCTKALNDKLHAQSVVHATPITIGAAAVAAAAIYAGIIPAIVKQQEKEADIKAAQQLVQSGQGDVVASHVELLEQSPDPECDNFWWHSHQKQAAYLAGLLS